MPKLSIPARLFADASLFASDEETRFYLCGVHIDPAGILVTTNGHVLFAGNVGFPLPQAGITVPVPKPLISACKKGETLAIEWNNDDMIARVHAHGDPGPVTYTLEAKLVGGKFPDWRRILPRMDGPPIPFDEGFNTEYLARFGKVARGGTCISLTATTPKGPVLVSLGRDDAFGVIMPRRHELLLSIPEWVTARRDTQDAA